MSKTSKSTISLNIKLRKDTPQYMIDFFQKGIKNEAIPSILYGYAFRFDNKPRFSSGTSLFFEAQKGRFYLSIFHQFDFDKEGAEGYWFVGGLAQFAEDNPMAGYITHAGGNTQIFGFRDKMCFWKNDLSINFNSAKYKKPDLKIREIASHEIPFLEDMLFQAIFTPEGSPLPEKSIIFEPFLHHYIKDFGKKHDFALVAEFENKPIGAIWSRLFTHEQKGYGFVDKDTPEISMAVDYAHRNSGIGAVLLDEMLGKLESLGYKKVSLSVDKRNFAYHLYLKLGFIEYQNFVQFGSTGNGSMIGIWQPEVGKQIYMHLSADEGRGTELADNFVDFLRLLAIGYETLGYFSEHTIQELSKLAEKG